VILGRVFVVFADFLCQFALLAGAVSRCREEACFSAVFGMH